MTIQKKKKKNNYINNKDLYNELVKYNNQTGEKNISNYLGECFMLLATNVGKKPCFNKYSYLDEMKSDAIENMVMAINSFAVEKSQNPFGYFTQIAFRAFIRRIQFEKKQQYIKHKNVEEYFLHGKLDDVDNNVLSEKVIEDFESKNLKKKGK